MFAAHLNEAWTSRHLLHRALGIMTVVAVAMVYLMEPAAAQRDLDAIYQRMRALGLAGDEPAALIEAQRFVAGVRARYGTEHSNYGKALNALGIRLEKVGQFNEAENLHKQALELFEKTRDPSLVSMSIGNLAVVYQKQGKYSEAEKFYKQALEISERRPNAKDDKGIPTLGVDLQNLAYLYETLGRYDEAEGLYKRALAIEERTFGHGHKDTAGPLTMLARVFLAQGRPGDAEQYAKRALEIQERTQSTISPRNNSFVKEGLAQVYHAQGRYSEAEALLTQVLATRERQGGSHHIAVADTLNELGVAYLGQDRTDDAIQAFERALAIYEKMAGAVHPSVAEAADHLAEAHERKGQANEALTYSRKATSAVLAHAAGEAAGMHRSGGLVQQRANYFRRHVASLDLAARKNIEPAPKLAREALIMAQWAAHSSASAALQQMGLRISSGSSTLAGLVRESQDLAAYLNDRDKALVEAVSKADTQRNQPLIDNVRRQIAETEGKLAAVTARLEREFPDYAALASPQPLKAEEVQAILSGDEALLFFLPSEKQSYVFALTREGFDWKGVALGKKGLSEKITELRVGLDVDDLKGAVESGKVHLFSLSKANELYALLIGPVDKLVRSKKHLIVVPSDAPTSLPFQLLITDKPAIPEPGSRQLSAYRDAQWLIKRHALTVLPSIASLKALRLLARHGQGTKVLVGYGDPIFQRPTAAIGRPSQQVTSRLRAYTNYFSGVRPDLKMLAEGLSPLPETADELRAVANALGAPESDIHLGPEATEAAVKRADLTAYRVVYFATHGLVAGEVQGLAEPALVLSLPREATDIDDGLLTASEVAQLKLNADWVVLSACNTAAGEKPGAEALSGLARAFFYAGARALLVSHWRVDSEAAIRLTTSTFSALERDPTMGRAEALRRAMLSYMDDTSNPWNAYPDYWGPFSIVGEGGAQ
jgi:CHAT domain-containing protein/tetratricopeptide (TPR) repeat protein